MLDFQGPETIEIRWKKKLKNKHRQDEKILYRQRSMEMTCESGGDFFQADHDRQQRPQKKIEHQHRSHELPTLWAHSNSNVNPRKCQSTEAVRCNLVVSHESSPLSAKTDRFDGRSPTPPPRI